MKLTPTISISIEHAASEHKRSTSRRKKPRKADAGTGQTYTSTRSESLGRIKTSRIHRARSGRTDADNAVRGKDYTTICISLPVEYLAAIDELAKKRRMSRSALLRNAALGLVEETK